MEKFKKGLRWFFESFIWLGLILLIIDIVTKNVVAANKASIISAGPNGIELIPGFLAINYVENAKAAFGLGFANPTTNRIVYIVVATLAAGGIITYLCLKYKKVTRFPKAIFMMILAGAIGNLIDRIFYGFSNYCVIDWINFYGIWGWNFNIADSCIVIGVIMAIVYLIIEEVKEYKAKPKEEYNGEKILSADEKAKLEDAEESVKKEK